jgi:type VI secretion system FHA domain protein
MIGIRVVSRSGVPLERLSLGVPLTARFGEAVGDIGRGADCTLVLPDPDREISRRQVLITCRGDEHFICPIGSNLAVELNGNPLAPGVEAALEVGARIGIGPYLLQVERAAEPAASEAIAAEQPAADVQSEPAGPGVEDPLAFFGQPKVAGASVFGDLLDTPTSRGVRTPKAPSVSGQGAATTAVRATGAATERAESKGRSVRAAAQPSAEAPKPGRRARAKAGTKSVGAAKHGQASGDGLAAALFGGLGVAVPVDAEGVRQAQLVGRLLRAAIGGTLELLAARTIAKREMGENATLLNVRENNPLKFSPDADAALARLLAPPEHGFIEPLAAVQDAFGDLRAHQVAMLSGMRAALDEVLARFDPTALEPRLSPGALWDKLVPSSRKAKLWEQYCEQYAELLREVEGDFDTMFSRAFLRAYRAQLAELSRSQPR